MKKFRLLIHHHATAYQAPNKSIHLPSFIGRWVNALAAHVDEIGLLLYESDTHLPQQDEMISKSNVILWSLGPPGRMWDRIPRMKHLRKVCRQASQGADGLLIRGVTPRQMSVWKNTRVPKKAFLLVGSLLQTQSILQPIFWRLYETLMQRWRTVEVLRMAKHGTLMANSPLLVDELTQLNRTASFVPTNTISPHEFSPFHVRGLSNPRQILFCGRVVPEKGIKELINAVAQMDRSQPCVLDIVGPVESTFYQELGQLANELNISQNINWYGRIPYGHELMDFYQKADVFVLPTYFEGFPHVIWEAAANCCPVIATRVGGIPALWRDGEHGILIPPKSSSAIVQALQNLFGNDELRKRLIENAHTYSKGFTVDACAIHLVNTLRDHGWDI